MAKIHFLNVGHGDCTIIEHGNGNLSMIDINNGDELDNDSADTVLESLSQDRMNYLVTKEVGKLLGTPQKQLLMEAGYDIELTNPIEFLNNHYPGRSIFRYIQSHPDLDHMRGLAALENSGIAVLNFWDVANTRQWKPGEDNENDKADWEAYQRYRAGQHATLLNLRRGSKNKYYNQNDDGTPGGNGLEILSPTPELIRDFDEDKKRNNLSYILRYTVSGRSIIFGGDGEQAAWGSVHAYYGAGLKCDALKASHHGRDTGYHQEAVKAMSPSVAIVSVGKKPDTDASAKYAQYCNEVASTRWYGDITLEIDAQGNMNWTTAKQRKSQKAA
jgi:beta-lactamase superfamily II metal-dependent hydrolase